MNTRIARKILKHPADSKRMQNRLNKLYPSYRSEQGSWVSPSWHKYHRIAKAWVIVNRKIRKYGDKFKPL